MLQWLGLGAFTARVQFRSLVRELRSQKLRNSAKNDDNNNKILYAQERQSKVNATNNDKQKDRPFHKNGTKDKEGNTWLSQSWNQSKGSEAKKAVLKGVHSQKQKKKTQISPTVVQEAAQISSEECP